MNEAPEFIRVKRRRNEDSVQALGMYYSHYYSIFLEGN